MLCVWWTGGEKKREVAPKFSQQLQNVLTEDGKEVILSCTVTGTPAPEISWTHNGKNIDKSEDFVITYDKATGKIDLVIVDCLPDDQGLFCCTAKNAFGQAATQCTLTLHGAQQPNVMTASTGVETLPLQPAPAQVATAAKPQPQQVSSPAKTLPPQQAASPAAARTQSSQAKTPAQAQSTAAVAKPQQVAAPAPSQAPAGATKVAQPPQRTAPPALNQAPAAVATSAPQQNAPASTPSAAMREQAQVTEPLPRQIESVSPVASETPLVQTQAPVENLPEQTPVVAQAQLEQALLPQAEVAPAVVQPLPQETAVTQAPAAVEAQPEPASQVSPPSQAESVPAVAEAPAAVTVAAPVEAVLQQVPAVIDALPNQVTASTNEELLPPLNEAVSIAVDKPAPTEPAVNATVVPETIAPVALAPAEQVAPAPAEQVAPAPAEQVTPAPAQQVTPAPVEPEIPAPALQAPKAEGSSPTFTTPIHPCVVKEGESCTLSAVIGGTPQPEVVWLKDQQPLVVSDHYITGHDKMTNLCTLTINSAAPSDSAVYTCQATNAVGKATCTANVVVVRKYFLLLAPYDFITLARFIIYCKQISMPKGSILKRFWYDVSYL